MGVDSGKTFTLLIESGLHAGVVQRLAPGIYTLGSELDADIILSDKDIEAVHLIVELDRHGLRLEPLQGAIAVDGESVNLEPGGERHLSLPASFSIGDARIRITAPKDAVQTRRRQRAAIAAASLVLLAIIGFQVAGPWAGLATEGPAGASMQGDALASGDGTTGPSSLSENDGAGDGVKAAPGIGADPAATPAVTGDQAAKALRARLAAQDLTDIEVRIGDGRIMVSGDAPPERMDEWQNIRIWFDGAFGQDVLLMADVEAVEKETPPKLAIEAVWSGDDPYLVAGGRRFFEGASIGDGWMIERIGADEITFKRGDASFSLAL